MTEYRLPREIRALIFDIDRTLYNNDEYANDQIEGQYRMAADHWQITVDDARERVGHWRAEYASRNGGGTTSLGNVLAGLGIPIETSVAWRTLAIHPEEFLTADPALSDTIRRLGLEYALIALTNNPVAVGRATLDVLGVSNHIPDIVGLDTTWRSKPDSEPFREALRRLGTPAGNTVSVGDRYSVDIEPALSVGISGILVEGVHEVYEIPDLLADRRSGRHPREKTPDGLE